MSISLLTYSVTGDCSNTNSGSVFLSVTGSTPPFAVNCISTPCALPTSALTAPYEYYVTGLSGGTFFLQITDGGGASSLQSVYISTGTTASIDSSHTTCGFDNGTVSGFTSGVYGFTTFYLYDGSNNYLNSGTSVTNNFTFTSLSAGTYYLVANDGGGCTGITASVIINPSTGFTFGGYVVNDASCLGGGSGKVFLTGLTLPLSAYTVTWAPSLPGQTGTTITGLTPGSYIATVTDPNGCSDSQAFTVNAVPPLTSGGFIVIQTPSCFQNNGEVEFIVVDGTPPYFFSGSSGQVEITFGNSVTFTGLTSGNYNFLVTDAGLCTIYDSVLLQTPNSFSTVAVNTTNSTCSTNNGIIQIIVDNGFSLEPNLLISISGSSGISQVGTIGSSIETFTGLPNGTYNYSASTASCVYTGQTTIQSVNLFSATTSVTGTTCGSNNGRIQVYTTSGGTFPYTFTLTGPSYSPITITGPLDTFTNLSWGNYTLTIQDSSVPNCVQIYNVFVPNSQNVYFDLFPTQPFVGNDGQITSFVYSGQPPFIYSWSGGSISSQTGSTVTGLTAGTYSLTVIDASGCSFTKTVVLTGTKKYTSYRYYNICDQEFRDAGFVTKRGMRSMFYEGFSDLTSGDTNCIVDSATFSIYAQVGSQSAQTEFYVSSGSTDYPNDQLWATTIVNTLEDFVGISGVTYDIASNRLNLISSCEELKNNCGTNQINPLQDNEIIVNLVIDYNISCVSCS